MSYPYSSLHLEADRAQRRLTQAFRDQRAKSLPPASIDGTVKEQEEAANRPQLSRQRDVLLDLRPNTAYPNTPNSARSDMSATSFTLTLLLFATIAAAHTDQPAFWLLIGPAPLAVGFAVIALFRRRFDLPAFRKRNGRSEDSQATGPSI
jgi:hypothetical protein